ncbi:hypothetical protein PIB30_024341 [Stylosanthes scabra]|uniref:Uncharacterized protein n=1 Tax=Stylosanthes scabra TaxID=79078 RepID=A0ABU6Z966_9FABA|nr:hypothetical protein [Stylosanthes scabra]
MAGAEDRDAVAVSEGSPAVMRRGAANHGVAGLDAVVDVDAVDDNIGDVLDGNACTVGDMDVDAAAVDCLEAVHDELLLQCDHHVVLEHDPQGPVLDHAITEGAGLRVHSVVVGGVCDDVVAAVAASDCIVAKANGAGGEAFASEVPAVVAAPAVVDRVAGPT